MKKVQIEDRSLPSFKDFKSNPKVVFSLLEELNDERSVCDSDLCYEQRELAPPLVKSERVTTINRDDSSTCQNCGVSDDNFQPMGGSAFLCCMKCGHL